MGNPITDYMGDWLNKTYAFLKAEREAGRVRPAATVGPGVLPTGPYSLLDDPGAGSFTAGGSPIPFNPADTGLAPLIPNEIDTSIEIAKENPAPDVVANGFQLLYGAVGMKGCISDQKDGRGNPNAQQACADFAQTGDTSLMILSPSAKKLLGILPAEEKGKPDDVQGAEADLSLTGQIAQGGKKLIDDINKLLAGAGKDGDGIPDTGGAEGGGEGEGEGGFFQAIEKSISDILAGIPGVGGTSVIPWNLILTGGAVFVLLLVITR